MFFCFAPMPLPPIRLRGDLALRPVLELEPGRYAREGRSFPRESGAEAPHLWDRYWRDSLADAGIGGLEPLRAGSWLVELHHLERDDVLRAIVERALADMDPDDDPCDRVGPLDGGYLLACDDEPIIEPRCCGDLTNLDDWRGAAECRAVEPQTLWIGHPSLLVHRDGDHLVLEETTESGSEDELRVFLVDPAAIGAAIIPAAEQRNRFAARLLPFVTERVGEDVAHAVCDTLAGIP
jgi:hypothetical protein